MVFELEKRIPVAILGATGMVGQRFIELLANHPWFELVGLAASDRHAGRAYAQSTVWRLQGSELPEAVASLPVVSCRPEELPGVKIVFSALPAEIAGEIEEAFAVAGVAVFSNAKNHRMDADVPLLIPEVNSDHLRVIEEQRRQRGWSGAIITNANCCAIPLVMALKPLVGFGLRKVMVTTMQAISGAGYPGVSAYDIIDNVIPFIGGEEEKLESETRKMLGSWESGSGFQDAAIVVSAQCNRVATREGHLECVSIELSQDDVSEEEIIAAWRSYQSDSQELQLPSAPADVLLYREEENRPQPIRDRDWGNGMTISLGRLRKCSILSYKFVVLGHNTIRGAAGCSILNAEYFVANGLLD